MPNVEPKQLPQIDFSTFLVSLATSAQLSMGLAEAPAGAKVEKNLQLAQQTIDIIALIEEKTRGNLTAEEADLLKNILYDLRLTFVAKSKG